MKPRLAKFATLLTTIALLASSAPSVAAICKPASDRQKTAAWQAYRARFPFLMQGIARMQGAPGCTLIVIGEPPPELRVDALLAAVDIAEQPGEVRIEKQSFGGDGWTKDLVFTIDGDTAEHAANTISLIHQHVFGTSFRAWTIDLDVPARAPAPAALDLQLTPGDLRAWLFAGSATFTPVLGGSAHSARQLLAGARRGVYEATNPPLVAWVLEPALDIDRHRTEARQFAMASDLVIGAVISDSRVIAIGRSRTTSFEMFPPLRTESLELLASAPRSLAQSYERNSPLAGVQGTLARPLTSWAPVYLSPALIDTELGSLLNLADQLLKSFSNAGKTRYGMFAYPDPARWPFGTQPVYDYLGGGSLTYNWNTTDFASLFVGEPYSVMAFRSTGALPLDYLSSTPSARSKQASELGRRYFAGIGDANLARVVQYVALYHVFQLANVAYAKQPFALGSVLTPATRTDESSQFIEDATTAMVTAYAQAPATQLRAAIQQVFDATSGSAVDPDLQSLRVDVLLAQYHGTLFDNASEPRMRQLAKLWISPPHNPTAQQKAELEVCEGARVFMQRVYDIEQARADYQASRAAPRNPWIHTSSWVTSSDEGLAEGGHNVNFGIRPVGRLPAPRRWQDTLVPGGRGGGGPVVAGGWSAGAGRADKRVVDAYRGGGAHSVARLERKADHYQVSFSDRDQRFTSWTLADATDVIANVLDSQGAAQPLRLHLEGFEAAEGRNFRAQTERVIASRRTGHKIDVITLPAGMKPAEVTRLHARMSFEHLRLGMPALSAPNVVEATIHHSAPGRLGTFVAAIRVYFRDAVTKPMFARASRVIETAFAALRRTGSGSRLDASFALQRTLREQLAKEGLEAVAEIGHENADIVVVELEQRSDHTRS